MNEPTVSIPTGVTGQAWAEWRDKNRYLNRERDDALMIAFVAGMTTERVACRAEADAVAARANSLGDHEGHMQAIGAESVSTAIASRDGAGVLALLTTDQRKAALSYKGFVG